FLIPLLPFLGLGNIATRYAYMASFGIVLLLVLVFKMGYEWLAKINKNTAIAILIGVVAIFSYFQIYQLQKTNNDWEKAGEITNNLLVDLRYIYPKNDNPPYNITLIFVNVPIKYGQAWIFPVGLPDAAWFTLQDVKGLKIVQVKTLDEAFQVASATSSARVLEFESDGSISEVHQTQTIVPTK